MKSKVLLICTLFLTWSASAQIVFQNHVVSGGPNDDNGAYAVHSADIDGDGDMDVISAAYLGHKVSWYENTDGKGTFGPQHPIATDVLFAWALAAADIDGDGDMDVLSASNREPGLAWYENLDGKGTFGPTKMIGGAGRSSNAVHVADLDNDGDMDVVSTSLENGNVVWHENTDGKGTFAWPKVISDAQGWLNTISSADMDKDGDLDVVTVTVPGREVAWFENTDGQGAFDSGHVISDVQPLASSIHTADMDNDNDPDVLFFSLRARAILWHENADGLGNFGDAQAVATFAGEVHGLHPADVDGDGDLDILAAVLEENLIVWYEHIDGQGNFGPQQVIWNNAKYARSVFAADLDGDGDADALSASSSDDRVAWYENTDGQGDFGDQQLITLDVSSGVASAYAADLDGDGDEDIMSVSPADGKVAWYENRNGSGDFGPQQVLTESATDGATIRAVDLDDDGDLDILIGARFRIFWFENTDGQATFSAEKLLIGQTDNSHMLQLGDVDGDDDLDIITVALDDDKVVWYENMDGKGSFSDEKVILSVIDPNRLFPSDLDNDGDLDVVWSSLINDAIGWAENSDGQGTFVDRGFIATDVDRVSSIFAADADGDGDADLFSVFPMEDRVVWFENMDGLGNFGTIHTVANDLDFPNLVYASDLDDDGDMDLISASPLDRELVWYRNLIGQGLFSTKQVILTGVSGFRDIYTTDFNNDGAIDILSAIDYEDRIYWHESVDPTSIKEIDNLAFRVYPVPATSELYIKADFAISKIEIYDLLGNLLLQKQRSDYIDLSQLQTGVYFCKILTKEHQIGIRKIIKR